MNYIHTSKRSCSIKKNTIMNNVNNRPPAHVLVLRTELWETSTCNLIVETLPGKGLCFISMSSGSQPSLWKVILYQTSIVRYGNSVLVLQLFQYFCTKQGSSISQKYMYCKGDKQMYTFLQLHIYPGYILQTLSTQHCSVRLYYMCWRQSTIKWTFVLCSMNVAFGLYM